jgi:hypothetical protein
MDRLGTRGKRGYGNNSQDNSTGFHDSTITREAPADTNEQETG